MPRLDYTDAPWICCLLFGLGTLLFAGPPQERHEVKLSPDAMLKIQVADLQQRLAETQAELGIMHKQLVELQSNDTRRSILMAECERGKIPIAECKYDPVVSSVFRLALPETK